MIDVTFNRTASSSMLPRATSITLSFFISLAVLVVPRAFAQPSSDQPADKSLDFQRDVRPILSAHCFKCHGPDDKARKSGLRLDVRQQALNPAKSGARAIVPTNPSESQLVTRIFSSDPDELMPPPGAKLPLTTEQKEILKRWITAGAEYTEHWAFIPPLRWSPPIVQNTNWPRNAIDHFILARLEKEGLQPSPPAGRYTLVRRLYLDLIGLPPTPEEADAFVQDPSPLAYETLVDQLLASPHYGERWARHWLDLARYSDTNGYEKDRRRSIWPYRDWVINALNADLPFDQFTIEQIAGDMLPNPTPSQRIATGFHRNTMLNEEGGIDPLEFRYHAVVDRINTTATAWLGLTLACAQCHTHKYDPIPHESYYQMLAFLNNADEPEIEVPNPAVVEKRAAIEKQIAQLTANLPNRFPVESLRWEPIAPTRLLTDPPIAIETAADQSFLLPAASTNSATLEFASGTNSITTLQIEFLADPTQPKNGPGRSPEGEAILSELIIKAAPANDPAQLQQLKIASASTDSDSKDHPVAHAIDGKNDTGWLIQRSPSPTGFRTATFTLDKPVHFPDGTRWIIELQNPTSKNQAPARLRVSLGNPVQDDRPESVRRKENLQRRFDRWRQRELARAVTWFPLRPAQAKSNLPLLTLQADDSILASGDQTKSDTYELRFTNTPPHITAIRIEAIPDERLPRHGPGRAYYEGPAGDFTLSEISLHSTAHPIPFRSATHSFATGHFTAEAAIDGNPQTGWSIDGGQGKTLWAVFNLAAPLAATNEFTLKMIFERHYSAGLGRFRIWATTASSSVIPEALGLPRDIEILLASNEPLNEPDRTRLLEHYLTIAPELAPARKEIDDLRKSMPAYQTTLAFQERPPENPRSTHRQHRGEFLQPAEKVEPSVLPILHPMAPDVPRNRLSFARWLVDPNNPLVGRVVMNRHWAALFGTGIVRTVQDFGFQGESPSHPELLDWLALEWIAQNWSVKKMHRLIVTSATYQQSSRVTPSLLEKDPQNRLLARGPRFRIEAELVRDTALRAAGLLSEKIGGPSVFPLQPPGITTEGTYGPLEWKVSPGEDRHRRGLYTFSKRTAPYAMFITFDGPSGEACIARREVSNTPLQALTLLNDAVFVETAQALGQLIARTPGNDESRAILLFRRCLTRPPHPAELTQLLDFYRTQQQRLQKGELDAKTIAGPSSSPLDTTDPLIQRAAWTAAARALLNLDQAITKN